MVSPVLYYAIFYLGRACGNKIFFRSKSYLPEGKRSRYISHLLIFRQKNSYVLEYNLDIIKKNWRGAFIKFLNFENPVVKKIFG